MGLVQHKRSNIVRKSKAKSHKFEQGINTKFGNVSSEIYQSIPVNI